MALIWLMVWILSDNDNYLLCMSKTFEMCLILNGMKNYKYIYNISPLTLCNGVKFNAAKVRFGGGYTVFDALYKNVNKMRCCQYFRHTREHMQSGTHLCRHV